MKSDDEKVLYSDGGSVTVTESVLQVKKTWYDLRGITKYGLIILQPSRIPWLAIMALGVALLVTGSMKLLPADWMEEVYWGDVVFTVNLVAAIAGSLLTLMAIGVMLSVSESYAVSITTAEGEQQVVVSKRKEYVTCIIRALNNAFFARIPKGDGKVREYTVSSR